METVLLTKAEVAELLGVHQRTLDNLVKAGKLPGSINIGRQKRWRKQDIEAWLSAEFQSLSREHS